MRLSGDFTLAEMVRSRTACVVGIDNTPGKDEIANMRLLCCNVLQPARWKFGPITVLSGYRCPELNARVGGVPSSFHKSGMAADIVPTGAVSVDQLGEWIVENCQFTELIFEYGTWIHVAYDQKRLDKEVGYNR